MPECGEKKEGIRGIAIPMYDEVPVIGIQIALFANFENESSFVVILCQRWFNDQ